MKKLSELSIMETIFDAEEKHGVKTHMVIEAVPKSEDQEHSDDPNEDEVVWWVEFENLTKVFENFDDVKSYLLEEAVATGEGPEVQIAE